MERPREAGRPPKPRSTRASTGAPIHRRPGTGAGGEPHAQKGRKGALRRALRPSSPSAHRATRGRATQAHATHAHALHGRNAGPARRDPPPSQRGGGAGHVRQRVALGPHRGGRRTAPPHGGGGGNSAHAQLAAAGAAADDAQRGGRLGGTQYTPEGDTPPGSLEKTISHRRWIAHDPPVAPPPSGPQRRRSGTPRGVGGV